MVDYHLDLRQGGRERGGGGERREGVSEIEGGGKTKPERRNRGEINKSYVWRSSENKK